MKRALPRDRADQATRDRKVLEEELDYLGPVAIAVFVDMGWIRLWPMSWSRGGLNALRNGYGRWWGHLQDLPVNCVEKGVAAHWHRRRCTIPVGSNIPIERPEAA